jgi:quercetin dioxygenase-like cupin family protein
MGDSTITKVDSSHSPKGQFGQKYLASGKTVSMRLWDEDPGSAKEARKTTREYEAVGYVLEGSADLEIEGQTIHLNAGDSWVVPKGAQHSYHIKEHFKAIEATAPPAQVHGRDE